MKRLSADQKKYLVLNAVLLGFTLLYPLYYYWVFHYNTPLSHCFLKEVCRIYCPLCGGTRCAWELLHFRFLNALRYNAYVVFFAVLFLCWEVATLVRFLRGEKSFIKLPKWVYIVLIALFLLFFAARIVLFYAFGVDPIGDLSQSVG